VHKTKGRSALEDELSTIWRLRSVELSDDVSKDVVSFRNKRVNAIIVGPTRDCKPCQHR
jgi:hypothetical protein